MKKAFFTTLLAFLTVFAVRAQDNESTDTSSKWQMRFRLITAIPSVDDDIDGADVDISNSFVPELDFTYFFNENWAAELILGTTKHDVDLDGTDLGHVWLLPPTLNLQYHIPGGDIKPYFGAGINYTIFYGVDEGDLVDMDYDNSVGFSMQAGFDVAISDKWFLNLDIKKILLTTNVKADTGAGVLPAEVVIDPWVIGFGAGIKF